MPQQAGPIVQSQGTIRYGRASNNGKQAAACDAKEYLCVKRKGYILVVETDDLIRELLGCWLEEAGYTVVLGDYENRVSEGAPCLVVANISNPRGAQALIRSLQAVYAAPILVLSARFRRGLGGSRDAARLLGVRNVLPKPFSREELLGAVGEAIESS
jgi:DNA-binding response OmpR family regulator